MRPRSDPPLIIIIIIILIIVMRQVIGRPVCDRGANFRPIERGEKQTNNID